MSREIMNQFGEMSVQSGVVIQCTHDKRDTVDRMRVKPPTDGEVPDTLVYDVPATLDEGICRIDIGDLVFIKGTSAVPRGALLNDAPPVTSYLNGFFVNNRDRVDLRGKENERRLNMRLSEGIRFVGVAVGATSVNPTENYDQKLQLTVRVQGTTSVYNNSECSFVPGDVVLWDIPNAQEREDAKRKRFGRSPHKVMLRTIPLKAKHMNYESSISRVFNATTKEEHTKQIVNVVDEFALDMKKMAAFFIWVGMTSKTTKGGPFKDFAQFSKVWDEMQNGNTTDKIVTTVVGRIKDVAQDSSMNSLIGDSITGFLRIQSDIERRKVGKCLNYCKPGAKIDLLIGAA